MAKSYKKRILDILHSLADHQPDPDDGSIEEWQDFWPNLETAAASAREIAETAQEGADNLHGGLQERAQERADVIIGAADALDNALEALSNIEWPEEEEPVDQDVESPWVAVREALQDVSAGVEEAIEVVEGIE